MTWTRLDDNFADDEEVWDLSDAAFRLYVSGLLFCNRRLTDGRIRVSKVASLVPMSNAKANRAAQELVDAGKWSVLDAETFGVVKFLNWNKSKERVMAEREAKAMAGAMGAATRWRSKGHGTGGNGTGSGEDRSNSEQGIRRSRKALVRRAYETLPAEVLYPGGEQLSDDDAIEALRAHEATK